VRFRARKALVVLAAGLAIGTPSAWGGTVWQWTHEAEGEGKANVFDGGPPGIEPPPSVNEPHGCAARRT
jgi:hypothetical protein